jgi:hypothetical protein
MFANALLVNSVVNVPDVKLNVDVEHELIAILYFVLCVSLILM